MQHLNGVYTQAFNRRHNRSGHLLQGRYKAILIEREAHLLELSRYIVLNPVRARLCTHPAEFPWTSYRATAGLEPPPRFLTVDALLSLFGADSGSARERYRTFVTDGIEAPNPFAELRGTVLGSDEFVRRATTRTMPGREIPRASRDPLPPSLERLLAEGERGILPAYREHGYTLAAIAEHLGCHYSTVSRRLRALEDGRDPPPRRRRRRA
jgi:AraC-like DNA-binding protein